MQTKKRMSDFCYLIKNWINSLAGLNKRNAAKRRIGRRWDDSKFTKKKNEKESTDEQHGALCWVCKRFSSIYPRFFFRSVFFFCERSWGLAQYRDDLFLSLCVFVLLHALCLVYGSNIAYITGSEKIEQKGHGGCVAVRSINRTEVYTPNITL